MQIQWAVQSYKARALPLAAQQVVNLYAEQAPQDAKDRVVLYGTPGIKSFADDVGTGPIRGMEVMAGVLYAVSGCELYSVDSTGKATALGNICTGQAAGSAPASVSFSVTAGTSDPDTNTISSLTVDGVELLVEAVNWVTSNAATASAFESEVEAGGKCDLNTVTYSGNSLNVTDQDNTPRALAISPDGTTMFMGGAFNSKIFQYTMGAPWDLASAAYDGIEFSVSTSSNQPNAISFKDDGTKMYIISAISPEAVYQFSLPTAYRLTGASYDNISFSVSGQDTGPVGLAFKVDGTKMYVLGGANDKVYQYSLSPAWDVENATYDSVSKSVSPETTTTRSLAFQCNGEKMYIVGASSSDIFEYDLSSPWVVSSAVYNGVLFNVNDQATSPAALVFKEDGARLYITGLTSDSIFQYFLQAPTEATVSVDGDEITIIAAANSGIDWNGMTAVVTTTGDVLVDSSASLELTFSGGYLIEGGLNALPSDLGRVSMSHNAASTPQLAIVDGFNGWIYTTTGGLQRITDTDFLSADVVDFQDQYFVFNRAGTGQFFLSNLNDGTVYTATDIATAEGDPDDLVALISNHRELWLFGAETIEVWYNSGNADFPFNRFEGAFIERGLAAAFSIAEDDNTLFWLGEDRIVYRAVGYTPQRISQHAIEEAIRDYAVISDACAFIYTMAGHKFYILTFIDAKATWVYDITTGLWHERESFGLGLWRATTYAEAYGRHLVGDYKEGKIGELDLDTYQEYGQVMQGLATGPPVYADRKRVFHRRFELDIEAGTGLTSGQGSDPQVWLDWSDNGGHAFSARKPFRSMGKIGAYRDRLRWLRLGQARQRIYRLTVSDAVKRSIVAAHLDAEGAEH